MPLNYQEAREQVRKLGEDAPARALRLRELRQKAHQYLETHALELDFLRKKVERVIELYEPSIRCALPVNEALDATFPTPSVPARATLLAADGSQIASDRHLPVEYCLINTGAVRMQYGVTEPPMVTSESRLFYGESIDTPSGKLTDARLALMRDLQERKMLVRLAEEAVPPVITFTDGPMELWGSVEAEINTDFKHSLDEYLKVLSRLCEQNVATAGYVDKPSASPVTRLLEIGMMDDEGLKNIKMNHPLRGVTDLDLFRSRLAPGERSAVFAVQSKSAKEYRGVLALHFYYLNVGRPGHPSLARVEVPAWVADDPEQMGRLHACLIDQCQVMGNTPYPYLLHRAHETALVTFVEKNSLTDMIVLELLQRGVEVGEASDKQAAKDLGGRTAYSRGGKSRA